MLTPLKSLVKKQTKIRSKISELDRKIIMRKARLGALRKIKPTKDLMAASLRNELMGLLEIYIQMASVKRMNLLIKFDNIATRLLL